MVEEKKLKIGIDIGELNNKINIVEEIRKFVEEECKKPTSKYGYAPYFGHFLPVANYSVKLAKQKNADLEVVEIAAWLHDIGSIICGRENHHITGAEIAEKKLREIDYPEERIQLIKRCILNHRGSVNNHRESVEEQIIAEADAISAFNDIDGLFQAAFLWEKLNQKQARISVREKLVRKYNQLSLEGKELIKLKYDAAMLLLGD
ncbi:MAG: HD domain-containing protein [Nanoarchaeota archaeon]|nr:HD domain-containing protein [Nanoarchaeota archaeon]